MRHWSRLGHLRDLRVFFGGHSLRSGDSQETFGITRFSGVMPENETTPPSSDHVPGPEAAHASAPTPPRRGRRLFVLPAVAAALALGLGGAGIGYAAAREGHPSASTTSPQGSSSNVT